jgi:hypothetical protein
VAREKSKLGPYSSGQLKELAQTGQVWPEDMIWREGERKWVAASAIKGLFVMAAKPSRPAAAAPSKPKEQEPMPENPFANLNAAPSRRRDQRMPRDDNDRPRRRPDSPPAKKGSGGKVVLFVLLGVGLGCTGLCGGGGYWIYTRIRQAGEEFKEGIDKVVEDAGKKQEYTITLKSHPDKGKSTAIRETENQKGSAKTLDAGGKLIEESKGDETKKIDCRETVLEPGNDRPKKYKESFDKAEVTESGKSHPLSFHRRTVLFELKDGKYQVKPARGPALAGPDLATLADRPSKHELDAGLRPANPVKVGDTWNISVDVLARVFASEGELDKPVSKGEAKLANVYDKDGKKWATIEFTLNLKVKSAKGLNFDPPAVAEFKGKLDAPIDGSSTARKMNFAGPYKGKGQVDTEKGKITVDLDATVTFTEERDAETDPVPDRDSDSGPKEGDGGNDRPFISQAGGYSVAFPAAPKETSEKNVRGDVTHTALVEQDGGKVAFIVMYTIYREGKGLGNTTPQMLLDGIVKGFGSALKRKKAIKIGDNPGFELVVERMAKGQTILVTSRVFVARERLYQVMVGHPKGMTAAQGVAKFLDSFKLLESSNK